MRTLRSVGGVMLAMALSRLAQNLLPARPRPRIGLLDFPFPPLGHLSDLADWSSMPSDHAALAFALAAVAWTGSRRLGLVAGIWAALGVASVAVAVRRRCLGASPSAPRAGRACWMRARPPCCCWPSSCSASNA